MLVFALHARYSKCFLLSCARNVRNLINRKSVITEQKLLILLKPRAYLSFWATIFQESDFKLTDVANNVRKLDHYLIISYSSLAPNAEFYVIYTQVLQLLLPNFFVLEICFSCTYYEQITPIIMGGHRARFIATRRQREN